MLGMLQENSKIQKQIVCEKCDRMSAILEERRKIMIQQITYEEEEKMGWTQSLVQTYSGHLDTNSKLVRAAHNAIEEPEMAAFVQVSQTLFNVEHDIYLYILFYYLGFIFIFSFFLIDLKRSYWEVSYFTKLCMCMIVVESFNSTLCFVWRVCNASTCFTLETLEPGYENMDHYKVDFNAEEQMLHQLDFLKSEHQTPSCLAYPAKQ